MEKYPKDVRVIIKNYPLSFHKQASKAARYALAAHKQGKYKEMYHMIFCGKAVVDNSSDECKAYGQLKNNEDKPLDYAKELNLDMNQFIKDLESAEIATQLQLEVSQFNSAGFPRKSVPKFLLQGKEIRWSNLMQEVESEIAKLK